MDLAFVFKFLTAQLKEVTPESFHQWNGKDKVIYPYLTFDVNYTPTDEIREVYEVVIDTFEYGSSAMRLLELESQLKAKLDRQKFILDEAIIHTRVTTGRGIPTGDDTIKRRHIRLKLKIDWRN